MKLPPSSLLASRITASEEFRSFRCAPTTGTPRGSRIFPETHPPFVLAARLKGSRKQTTQYEVRRHLKIFLEIVIADMKRFGTFVDHNAERQL